MVFHKPPSEPGLSLETVKKPEAKQVSTKFKFCSEYFLKSN